MRKAIQIIIAVPLMIFIPSGWFAIQVMFFWTHLPWFLAIPCIFVVQIVGNVLAAVILCSLFGSTKFGRELLEVASHAHP